LAALKDNLSVVLAANPQPKKLRVGVLAAGLLQPRWVIDAFAKVAAADFAEMVLIGVFSEQQTPAGPPSLLRVYSKIDRWAFGADPSELADLAAQVPHRRFLPQAAPAQLLEMDLDVLFVVGGVDDQRFDGVARYGVWRFCFGPQRSDPEALAGWREVAEGAPVTGSGIKVRLAAGATPRLAYQSWSRTYPLSVARNRERILRKTTEFPWRALRELHRSGRAWLEHCKSVRENRGQTPISARAFGNRGLTPIFDIGRRIAHRGVEKALFVEQWFIAFRFQAGSKAR